MKTDRERRGKKGFRRNGICKQSIRKKVCASRKYLERGGGVKKGRAQDEKGQNVLKMNTIKRIKEKKKRENNCEGRKMKTMKGKRQVRLERKKI